MSAAGPGGRPVDWGSGGVEPPLPVKKNRLPAELLSISICGTALMPALNGFVFALEPGCV